jgi:OPA family glycerol-3-phosphate transporter-like MFS transporter
MPKPPPDVEPRSGRSLFALLWLGYFSANLGRLSCATIMVDIIEREGFSAAAMGLVGTGFFICYGAGQIGSGYLGDRLSPGRLILAGLFCSGLANLAMGLARTSTQMLVIWCANGLVQSALWPPILRVIVENYPGPLREKVCVNISTSYPAAALVACGAFAGIVQALSWRAVFIIVSALLLAVSALWALVFGKLERGAGLLPAALPPGSLPSTGLPSGAGPPAAGFSADFSGDRAPGRRDLPFAALIIICAVLVTQGALRDGLMTWIPAYLARVFRLRTSAAILFSGLLPLVNLAGIYACQFIFRRARDEVFTSLCLYAVSSLAALGLLCFGAFHIVPALVFFALITASMVGVNLMLVSFVPTRFSRAGIVAFISGLTNAMVYLGSSIAVFGIGLTADRFGWASLLLILLALTLLSVLLCFLALPRWRDFTRRESRRMGY